MNFDYLQAMSYDGAGDEAAVDYMRLLEKEMRDVAEQEIQEKFEYLWERYGIAGNTTPLLIESFKEVALKWYMRGRFNE